MRRHRSNRNKYLLIAILLLVVVIVAAFAVFFTAKGEKPLASEYLTVEHTASTAYYSNPSNTTMIFTVLGLNVTAVGGDATGLYVHCKSQADPVDAELEELAKGKTWDLPITLTGGDYNYRGLQLKKNTQGMLEVDVTVGCNEARSTVISVLVDPKDVYITAEGEILNP
jgi:hypothetical protein